MPAVGSDRQRGGWYDMVERVLEPGQEFHRLVWHDRKAWWQQEQGILAYLILVGDRREARLSQAWHANRPRSTTPGSSIPRLAAYTSTSWPTGIPYALGTERRKGSHSMSGYHSFELCYLGGGLHQPAGHQAADGLLLQAAARAASPDSILRVAPDMLPAGSVRIEQVWIDGHSHEDFDPVALTVRLPEGHGSIKVRARLVPTDVTFSADVLVVEGGRARLALSGKLAPAGIKHLDEQMEAAIGQGAKAIEFDMARLEAISPEGVRFLIFRKQKLGGGFPISIVGAAGPVLTALKMSEFTDEVELI